MQRRQLFLLQLQHQQHSTAKHTAIILMTSNYSCLQVCMGWGARVCSFSHKKTEQELWNIQWSKICSYSWSTYCKCWGGKGSTSCNRQDSTWKLYEETCAGYLLRGIQSFLCHHKELLGFHINTKTLTDLLTCKKKLKIKRLAHRTAEVIPQDVEHIPTDGCGGFGAISGSNIINCTGVRVALCNPAVFRQQTSTSCKWPDDF